MKNLGRSDLPPDAARFWNAVVGSLSVRHLTKQGQLIAPVDLLNDRSCA
jgi:hypothetical protein